MGDREKRREKSARVTQQPVPVVQARTWVCESASHKGTRVEVLRGEACIYCNRRLLEG